MDFLIRPAAPSESEKIGSVLSDVFGDDMFDEQCSYKVFSAWAYKDNPDHYAGFVSEWVAELEGEIVAVWNTMPLRLQINGKEVKACWSQNTAVLPKARRKGLARKMFREIVNANTLVLGVGLTDMSSPLFKSEGVQFVNADRIVVLPLHLKKIGIRILTYSLNFRFEEALTAFKALVSRISLKPNLTDTTIRAEPIDSFGSEFGSFLSDVGSQISVMSARNVNKLNWIMQNPKIKVNAFAVWRNNEPCGYAILRSDGMILDMLVQPSDDKAFAAILNLVVESCKQIGLTQLTGIVPSVPMLNKMYKNSGFLPYKQQSGFGLFYTYPDPEYRDTVLDNPENWYLGLSDSDLYPFYPDRW